MELEEHKEALDLFSKAIDKFPDNKEGYVYRFLTYIDWYLKSKNKEYCMREMCSFLLNASAELNIAFSKTRRDSSLHRYRSILKTSQYEYGAALQEAVRAIKYADESAARDYFSKGVCEACLDLFAEAVEDFDLAISLDPAFVDAYLLKGKTAYVFGDSVMAFECYQQMVGLCPGDYFMHVHAGNLLVMNGAFREAINAFDVANEMKETEVGHYQKAKVRIV